MSFRKKKKITTEKQDQTLNHVQDIISLSNKLCELVRKEIIAVRLDCFSQESVNEIKRTTVTDQKTYLAYTKTLAMAAQSLK